VRFGAPDASLTGSAGVLALGELVAGLAQCQLLDGKFVNAVDRHRTDAAAQLLSAVPAVASTTAGGLTRCFGPARVAGIEAGNTTIIARGWSRLPARRRAAVLAGRVGIDLDATDVKVYGRLKRGVAYNYLGQRAGRPHLATWANTGLTLAADLRTGVQDVRAHSSAPLLGGDGGGQSLEANQKVLALNGPDVGVALGRQRIHAVGQHFQRLFLSARSPDDANGFTAI